MTVTGVAGLISPASRSVTIAENAVNPNGRGEW